MTLRRRLVIAFSIVVILPILLFIAAFVFFGNYFGENGLLRQLNGSSTLSDSVDDFRKQANELLEKIETRLESDPYALEDPAYLEDISDEADQFNAFVIVRKGSELAYTDNEAEAEDIFDNLPAYNALSEDMNARVGYYIGNFDTVVRQIDFLYRDGSRGSLFIGTNVVTLVSVDTLTGLLVALIFILLFTAICLTRWLSTSIFSPIHELNVAMNNIRDGNLDYVMTPTEKGEIGELYGNYEDMRLRLKESAEEKIEHDRQNKELVSNISHDLKTPITSVKGYVEGLLDGVANTPEKQEKYLRTIYNKTMDMDRLINELTLYSKIDNDRIPYNFRRLNVKDYFDDCVEEIGFDMESRGIELNYMNLVPLDTVIIADPEQMKRVINNIIGNSVKYMDKPRKMIAIRVLDLEDSIRVEIEDNGRGISPKDLPNIFDRFYRADASRNSAQGGSGIGLSIVRKIIEDHGGYIWATSHEGEGCCMQFVIRKYYEQEEPSVDGDKGKQKK